MAHKDNTKNAENAAKGSADALPEETVEFVAPVKSVNQTGNHTGVVQISPKVANPR
jgi:hypothetical protein